MPRSRVRDGRKAHNKRVKARNIRVLSEFKRASKMAWEKFMENKKLKEEGTDGKG